MNRLTAALVFSTISLYVITGFLILLASTTTPLMPNINDGNEYYELQPPMVWGDYGAMLMGGYADRDSDENLLVYRTGPFMPPITLPGSGVIVVSDAFRERIERSRLSGLSFRPAIKHRIVEFHWETWDRRGEMGQLLPINEPEDLLLNHQHSEGASRGLGNLWDAQSERLVTLEFVEERRPFYLRIVDSPPGSRLPDFFGSKNHRRVLCSAKAKRWLEGEVSEWVAFEPILVGD